MSTFENLFCSDDQVRDKFLSRVFGIFNENVVRCWCNAPQSSYEDIGRPTISRTSTGRGYTLDFTFLSRKDGSVHIGEMKCELEYDNYRFLTLESPEQLQHHKGEAFKVFLDAAKDPQHFHVRVQGKLQAINGAILVWGRCSEPGRADTIKKYGFHAVLSLEEIISDLLAWNNECFTELLNQRAMWCRELFDGLRHVELGLSRSRT